MRSTVFGVVAVGLSSLFSATAEAQDYYGYYYPPNPDIYVKHLDARLNHVYAISGAELYKINCSPVTIAPCNYVYQGDAGLDTLHLAVSKTGVLWRIQASTGRVQKWNGTGWDAPIDTSGRCAKALSVGADGEMWIVGCSAWVGRVYRFNGAAFVELQSSARAYEVTVAETGSLPWSVKASGTIGKWNGTSFVNKPGCAGWIGSDSSLTIAVGCDLTSTWIWDTFTNNWKVFGGPTPNIVIQDMSQDGKWLVDTDGVAHKFEFSW